jgi:hypothetical protein
VGGGTVVVPGDDSEYGRRYIVSQLNLKDNINLCIEKGAILWQSQRFEDYDYGDYEPVYGHDVVIPGAAWTHAAPCWNLPLLYFNEVKNVKVTGGGEIRMQDTGGEWLDGNGYSWDSEFKVLEKVRIDPGDVVVSSAGNVVLVSNIDEDDVVHFLCRLNPLTNVFEVKEDVGVGKVDNCKFASNRQKQELFDCLASRGYRYNPETDTLEELIKPKFTVKDLITYLLDFNMEAEVLVNASGVPEGFDISWSDGKDSSDPSVTNSKKRADTVCFNVVCGEK